MKPTLRQRMKMLRLAAKAQRLEPEVRRMIDDAREAEGTNCGYCGEWRTWKDLEDESTQTEQRPLICKKCINRRANAHASGWHNWPTR